MKRKSKKARIIKMFNEAPWLPQPGSQGRCKVITKSDFERFDMYGGVEYRDTHNDVFYARRIIQECFGYKVAIGSALYVYENIKASRNKDTNK